MWNVTVFAIYTESVFMVSPNTFPAIANIYIIAIFIFPNILLLLSIVIIFLIHIMLLFSSLSFQKGVILPEVFSKALQKLQVENFWHSRRSIWERYVVCFFFFIVFLLFCSFSSWSFQKSFSSQFMEQWPSDGGQAGNFQHQWEHLRKVRCTKM